MSMWSEQGFVTGKSNFAFRFIAIQVYISPFKIFNGSWKLLRKIKNCSEEEYDGNFVGSFSKLELLWKKSIKMKQLIRYQ